MKLGKILELNTNGYDRGMWITTTADGETEWFIKADVPQEYKNRKVLFWDINEDNELGFEIEGKIADGNI